jgi:dipeptidyl aminopeptidase/acylaminoacyl peptidase
VGPLAWSPDGRFVAYRQGDESRFYAYNQEKLAVVPAAGGAARVLTASLDRSVDAPAFSADGKQILFLVADDRTRYLASVPAAGGPVRTVVRDQRVISDFDVGRGRRTVLISATARTPTEVYALDGRSLRPLTRHNESWLGEVETSRPEGFTSRSRDGTLVNGLVTRPAGARTGERLPAVLLIHGGPGSQDAHEFDIERETFAAAGYLVIQANYRGSDGRGSDFQKAIYADWGNKEVIDLLGALDHFVALGAADPDRVASVGWSYGGMLTTYLIASDTRFKAAASTAGMGMTIIWGVDQYSMQYELEIGQPWNSQDLWTKLSYPFFHADRIRTPTLFLCGEKDFNVPLAGSEQMYQALRSLNVPTQLVIYPDLFHGLDSPAALEDRLERQLSWLARHMRDGGGTPP